MPKASNSRSNNKSDNQIKSTIKELYFQNLYLISVSQNTVCPKLFGTPKMYQNGLQMSNYCAQLPPHTRLYIHGRPQILKSPYGYTQGPKFIVFQNARIQTIFEDVKKTYFKFNQITMRPAYNGEELFFEQNK